MKRLIGATVCLFFVFCINIRMHAQDLQGEDDMFRAISFNSNVPPAFAYNDDRIIYFTLRQRFLLQDITSFFSISTSSKQTQLLRRESGRFSDIDFIGERLFANKLLVAKPGNPIYGFKALLFGMDSSNENFVIAEIEDPSEEKPGILGVVSVDHGLYAYVAEKDGKINLYKYNEEIKLNSLVAEDVFFDKYGPGAWHDTFLLLTFGGENKPATALINDEIVIFPSKFRWASGHHAIHKEGVLYYTTATELLAFDLTTRKEKLLWQYHSEVRHGDYHFFAMEGDRIYFMENDPQSIVAINVETSNMQRYSLSFSYDSDSRHAKFIVIDNYIYMYDDNEQSVKVCELQPA